MTARHKHRGRDLKLSVAVELLEGQHNIDIAGMPKSGRTSFLTELQHRLENIGIECIRVNGVGGLHEERLGALAAQGLLSRSERSLSVPHALEAFTRRLTNRRTVILADSWARIDKISRGVLQLVVEMRGAAIARTLTQKPREHALLESDGISPRLTLELDPLSSEDLHLVIRDQLGAAPDSATLARIFAKSGGNAGLAVEIALSARAFGRLKREGGVWRAGRRELWNPALHSVAEEMLADLSPLAERALELIALSGISELSTVRDLVSWDALEELETHALISVLTAGASPRLAITPPLLEEYFRRAPLSLRRIRHQEALSDVLRQERLSGLQQPSANGSKARETLQSAWFTRVVHDAEGRRELTALEAWSASKTVGNGVQAALALARNDASEREVEEVLFSEMTGGSPRDRAMLARYRAEWTAVVRGDLDGALRQLERQRHELGECTRLVDAYTVLLTSFLREVPDDWFERLHVDESLEPEVAYVLYRTQALILTINGRFADAHVAYQQIVQHRHGETRAVQDDPIIGIIQFGLGLIEDAHAHALAGFERAEARLDMEACRHHAMVLSWILISNGQFDELQSILSRVQTAGTSPRFLPDVTTQLVLDVAHTIIAARERRMDIADAHRENAESLRIEGPLPAQTPEWARAQLLAVEGREIEAAEAFWQVAEIQRERGAAFASVLSMLRSVELYDSDERLTAVETAVADMPTPYLRAYAQYLRVRHNRDLERILDTCVDLERTLQTRLALQAFEEGGTWSTERGDHRLAAHLKSLRQELASRQPGAQGPSGNPRRRGALTPRELQVARLIAAEKSNQEIADELYLSVRTVETHVHRILKKTRASDRKRIREHL